MLKSVKSYLYSSPTLYLSLNTKMVMNHSVFVEIYIIEANQEEFKYPARRLAKFCLNCACTTSFDLICHPWIKLVDNNNFMAQVGRQSSKNRNCFSGGLYRSYCVHLIVY